MKKYRRMAALGIGLFLLLSWDMRAYASEYFEYDEAQDIIDEYVNSDFSIEDTVATMVSGDSTSWIERMGIEIKNYLIGEIVYHKKAILIIILIAIGSAVLSNFAEAFGSGNASEFGYVVSYMMIAGYLLTGFYLISSLAGDAVRGIMGFLTALIPTYCLSIGVAGGGTSAAGFYEMALVTIDLVNTILVTFMLPSVNIYVALMMVNNLYDKEYISRFADLIKFFIGVGLKGLMGLVIGLNVIQSLILPSVDSSNSKVISSVIKLIPGVGNGTEAVANVILGSGTLIKNAIGITLVLGMGAICVIPLIKLLVYIFMYKLTSAIMQPISDKRLCSCIDAATDGAKMLFKITGCSFALFSISIAVICLATNFKI